MKKIFLLFVSIIFFNLLFVNGVVAATQTPTIISVVPSEGRAGDTITISGQDFHTDIAVLKVYFLKKGLPIYSAKLSEVSSDGTTLNFVVNPILVTDSRITDYQIYVANTEGGSYSEFAKSNVVNFGVINGDAPDISSLSSSQGNFGDIVTVTGTNFKKSGTYAFVELLLNGKRIELAEPRPENHSETSLKFIINPALAYKFGPGDYQIRIINTNGRDFDKYTNSNAVDFKITKPKTPSIDSISSSKGKMGDTVTIFGSNFQTDVIKAKIEFLNKNQIIASEYPSYLNMNGAIMEFVISPELISRIGFGSYQIRIANPNGDTSGYSYSNSINFGTIPTSQAPSLSFISPTEAKTGDKVSVYGLNFNQYSFIELDNENINPTFRTSNSIGFVVSGKMASGPHKIRVGQWDSNFPLTKPAYLNVTATNATTTPEGSCIDLGKNLRYGREDNRINGDIYLLQSFLNSRDYLSAQPNGYFGRGTESAVEAFQLENGIRLTGEAGPLTRTKIKEISCNL